MKIVIKAVKGFKFGGMQLKQHDKIIKAYEELAQSKIQSLGREAKIKLDDLL